MNRPTRARDPAGQTPGTQPYARLVASGLRATASAGVTGKVEILHSVSLQVRTGELAAIMGPSGAGKSTLLRLLSGRARAAGGSVAICGLPEDRIRAPGAVLGHLHQDDILPGNLTLEESLRLTGRIRRPEIHVRTVDAEVEARMVETHISAQRASRLDHLSGGERRRANLCAELLSDPLFLFLDEPTANLDPVHSSEIMRILRRLADRGKGVVVVTHDVANWDLFDKIAFLADGELVFFGSPAQAVASFGAEDLAGIYDTYEARVRPRKAARRSTDGADPRARGEPAGAVASGRTVPTTSIGGVPLWDLRRASLSIWWRHFTTILIRSLGSLVGDRLGLIITFVLALACGALLAAIPDEHALVEPVRFGLAAQQTLVALLICSAFLSLANAHRELVGERTIFGQEEAAGLSPSAYLLAKLCLLAWVSLLQVAVLLSAMSLRVQVPLGGLTAPVWLEFLVTLSLLALANVVIGLLISALARTGWQASLGLAGALVAEVMLSGALLPLNGWPAAIAQAVPTRWAYRALGTAADLNRLSPFLYQGNPDFLYEPANLLRSWAALPLLAAGCLVLTLLVLSIQRRQSRPSHVVVAWVQQPACAAAASAAAAPATAAGTRPAAQLRPPHLGRSGLLGGLRESLDPSRFGPPPATHGVRRAYRGRLAFAHATPSLRRSRRVRPTKGYPARARSAAKKA